MRLFLLVLAALSFNASAQGNTLPVNLSVPEEFLNAAVNYSVPSIVLYSIAVQESCDYSSGRCDKPWPWTVVFDKTPYHFRTEKRAVSFVKAKIAQGVDPVKFDLGYGGINYKYNRKEVDFYGLDNIFKPNINIAYTAKRLSKCQERGNSIIKCIGLYHNGYYDKATLYRDSVASRIRKL